MSWTPLSPRNNFALPLENDLNVEFSVADMDLIIEQVLEVAKERDRLVQ